MDLKANYLAESNVTTLMGITVMFYIAGIWRRFGR